MNHFPCAHLRIIRVPSHRPHCPGSRRCLWLAAYAAWLIVIGTGKPRQVVSTVAACVRPPPVCGPSLTFTWSPRWTATLAANICWYFQPPAVHRTPFLAHPPPGLVCRHAVDPKRPGNSVADVIVSSLRPRLVSSFVLGAAPPLAVQLEGPPVACSSLRPAQVFRFPLACDGRGRDSAVAGGTSADAACTTIAHALRRGPSPVAARLPPGNTARGPHTHLRDTARRHPRSTEGRFSRGQPGGLSSRARRHGEYPTGPVGRCHVLGGSGAVGRGLRRHRHRRDKT